MSIPRFASQDFADHFNQQRFYMQKLKSKYTAFRLKNGSWKIKTPSGLIANAIYLNEREAVKQATAWNGKQNEFSESTVK